MAVTAIDCPYCGAEVTIPDEGAWHRCERCGQALHGEAQRAFAGARERYAEGLEIAASLSPRRRRGYYDRQEEELAVCYQQAYSSLQEAFRFTLPESQRVAGIEMAAEIMRFFALRQMVSPLEVSYWARLLLELNTRRECADLAEKLARPARGLMGPLRRLHWRLRQRQLEWALVRLDTQIRQTEQMIDFVEPLKVRGARDT